MLFTDKNVIEGNESEGNNMRFYKDGYFYKTRKPNTDENNIEVFVSDFLKCTSLKEDKDYVVYTKEKRPMSLESKKIFLKEVEFVKSKSFIGSDESFVTMTSLFLSNSLELERFEYSLPYDNKIGVFVDKIKEFTDLDISNYLSMVFLIDALVLNRDRHMKNIGLIEKISGKYITAPIFDNGLSFNTGQLHKDNYSKPFYQSHREQVYHSQRLSSFTLEINLNKFEEFKNRIILKSNKLEISYLRILEENLKIYNNYIKWGGVKVVDNFYTEKIKPIETDFDIIIESRLFDKPIAYILYNYKEDKLRVLSIGGKRPPILDNVEGGSGLNNLYHWAIEETYPPQRPLLDAFCMLHGLSHYEPLLLIKATEGKRESVKRTYKFIKFKFQPNLLFPDDVRWEYGK